MSTTQVDITTAGLLGAIASAGDAARRRAIDSVRERFDIDDDWDPLVRLLVAGGKSVRPGLVTLGHHVGRAGGPCPRGAAVATGGAAVELMHVGSLYHDDVLDDADERRGVPAIHVTAGNHQAILLGDILFAIGSELTASLGREEFRIFSETLRRLCDGQIRETRSAGVAERTVEEYLRAVSGKTAALFSCSTRIGGSIAGADATTGERLAALGHHLGIAFQIRDDILDLVGTEGELRKSPGRDLVAGVVTLPAILAQRLDPTLAPRLAAAMAGDEDPREVAGRIVASGALSQAAAVADEHTDLAARHLSTLAGDTLDSRRVIETFLPPLELRPAGHRPPPSPGSP